MKSKVSKNKARRVSCSQTFSSSMPHRADVSLLWQSRSAGSVVGTLNFLFALPPPKRPSGCVSSAWNHP